jgi:hypothetical protein
LGAVRAQAEDNLAKATAILELYGEMRRRIAELTRSQYAMDALDWIFSQPIFASSHFIEGTGIPKPTARRFLAVLREDGVIRTLVPASGRRAPVFGFPALLTIAEGRDVF